ncbi:MAG: GNAT family N-acetyltransferase [Desulfobacteraceae bacterium]|nr:GNAT family N-acetyltransferase [Desulfobacteraceae bacterium]
MNWEKEDYTITWDKSRIDIKVLSELLGGSHWAEHRCREDIEKSVANSICFGLFHGDVQIGFARVLTDEMAYAVILDMIIRAEFRGRGLGNWLMACIGSHPVVAPLRQVLWTSRAVDFYRGIGFKEAAPLKLMARSW